jgi:uncharacterized DUF497 family protein
LTAERLIGWPAALFPTGRSGLQRLTTECNPKKAASNAIKHQITFKEAESVFLDEYALVIPDPEHSAVEDRFVILGLSAENRALVVVHCFRQSKSVIRIISARKAGTKE